MLNHFAADYASRSLWQMQAVTLLLTLAAFAAAVLVSRSSRRLRRAPFFAMASAFLLVAVSMHRVWGLAIDDVASGTFWLIAGAQTVAAVVVGVGFGAIAAARARDAFGTRFAGLLAAVPVANLALLLAPSRVSAGGRPGVQTAALVLGGGAAALVAAVLLAGPEPRPVGAARTGPLAAQPDAASRVDALIRQHGLEGALALLAAETSPSAPAEANLAVLRAVEAEGTTLRFQHRIRTGAWFFDDDFRREFADVVCASAEEAAVLRAGGRIEHEFADPNGQRLGTIVVTRLECPQLRPD